MKTVELYNTDSEMYWNIEEFLKVFGYKNVQEFCAYERDTLGTKEYLYRNMIDLFKAHNNIVDYWELFN